MDTVKYKLTRFDWNNKDHRHQKQEEKIIKTSYEYYPDLVEKLVNSIKEISSDMDRIRSICILGERDSQKKYITLEELL